MDLPIDIIINIIRFQTNINPIPFCKRYKEAYTEYIRRYTHWLDEK